MQVETAICATCRCGWLVVTHDVKNAVQLLDEHVKWEGVGHDATPLTSVSNPLNPIAATFLRQQAKLFAIAKVKKEQAMREVHTLSTLYHVPQQLRLVAEAQKYNVFTRIVEWFMGGVAATHYDL